MTKGKGTDRTEVFGDITSDGTIVEAVYCEDELTQCKFAISRKNEDPTIEESFSTGKSTVFPPQRLSERLKDKGIVLPSGLCDYGSPEQLYKELRTFVAKYIDLDSFLTSLMAHYALMTWIWDAWNAIPYLRFQGEPGTGKTRCLEIMRQVCYRGVDLGVCPTKAALQRSVHAIRGTLFIDEADYDADLRSDLVKLLNAGYRRDGKIMISIASGDDWEPQMFKVGGPKIMANRMSFNDPALESRCLTIHMVSKRQSPEIPVDLPPTFEAEGDLLRKKLLSWRLLTFHKVNRSEQTLSGIDGRAKQLGLPIYNVSPDIGFKKQFAKFLQTRGENLREHDPSQVVFSAIRYFAIKGLSRVSLKELHEEVLSTARSREIPEWQFKAKRVAELVRGLCFRTSKWGAGTVVYIDPEILKEQSHLISSFDDAGDDSDDAGEMEEEQLKAA